MVKPIPNLLPVVLIIIAGIPACINNTNSNKQEDPATLALTDTIINLNIKEPSGLAFSGARDALYTVSDKTSRVYKISFQGLTLEKFSIMGNDLEGIDVDRINGDIWVVEEGLQHVLQLNCNGELIREISTIHINTGASSGFEGIAKGDDKLYILVEQNPGTLIEYQISTGRWSHNPLSFAVDYSGIDYDTSDNTLWIVSHESKALFHCDLSGTLIASQPIDVRQAEGVAVDRNKNIAWVVSDRGSKLHRIKLKI